MPNPALDAYLAQHYLDGAKAEAYLARSGYDDSKKQKKKRRKLKDDGDGASGSGFRLIDDNDESWKRRPDDSDEDVSLPRKGIASGANGGLVATKAGNEYLKPNDGESQVDAKDERGINIEPRGLADQGVPDLVPPSSSIRAGLKSREEMRAERELRQAQERERGGAGTVESEQERKERMERERAEAQQETIYRDASGRRIDVRQEELKEKQLKEDKQRLEREKQDWNKGEVQRRQAREQARREREEKSSSFARYADDERMNATLRNVERADDPAARFLTRKSDAAAASARPVYKGSYPPNRFNIRPGYRWDGVERSNGFEAKLFQRRNERSRRKAEDQGE